MISPDFGSTLTVGERRVPKNASDWKAGAPSGPHASFWASDSDIMNSEAQSILGSSAADSSTGIYSLPGPLCEGSYGGPNGVVFATTNPACLTAGTGAYGNPILPNRKPGVTGDPLKDEVSLGYSSPHLGGFQILMGDASVRFVSDSVHVVTWVNLARRADGEVLGAF